MSYIGAGVFLVGGDGGAAALSGVEGALASDGGLALRGAGAADFAADLGDSIPVAHVGGCGV